MMGRGGIGLAACLALAPAAGLAQPAPGGGRGEVGLSVFKRACAGCHKWHGGGGGGYGGDALSLRKTALTREQIAETVRCGRPGTGMPYHERGAYDTVRCYDSLRADMGSTMPPAAASVLRPDDVEAVAAYVVEHLQGRGEPNLGDCTAFFGDASRACNLYRKETPDGGATASPNVSPNPPPNPSH